MNLKKIQPKAIKKPIHLMKLSQLLKLLGVKARREKNRTVPFFVGLDPSPKHLWSLFDEAKRVWRERIALEHPDRGGSHEQAAITNSLWDNIQRRFDKMGIGT